MSQDPNSLINSVKAIPDLVWGGIIGVVGIIIGTLLSWIPVFLQLRHDSKERRISLLRDIYLSAAEKIAQEINYIANFYITDKNPSDGYLDAISKINILGTDETIIAVNTFNDYLIKVLLNIYPSKDRIKYLEMENNGLNNLMEGMVQKANKALQDMEEYNLRCVQEPTKWDVIQSNFDSAQVGQSELMSEYTKNSNEIIKLTSELALNCQQKAQLAEELLIPIITTLRKELGITFDEQAYREMMAISNKKWKENLQEHIASTKEAYEEFVNKYNRRNNTTNGAPTK